MQFFPGAIARIRSTFPVVLAAAALLLSTSSRAQNPGYFDPSLDFDGTYTAFDSPDTSAQGLEVDAQGRYLVVGISNYNVSGVNRRGFLKRMLADGTPDFTFGGGDGREDFFGQNGHDEARDVAIDRSGGPQNGKIYVVGSNWQANGDLDFGVMRFTPDGIPDPTFGNNGLVTTEIGKRAAWNWATSVEVQSDGKVVVAGVTIDRGEDYAVARYLSSGALDTSLGSNPTKGRVTVTMTNGNDRVIAVKLTSGANPKIVLAGSAGNSGQWGLARLNHNGSLDSSFDGDGKILGLSGHGLPAVTDLHVLANGDVYAAGRVNFANDPGRSYEAGYVHYSANGSQLSANWTNKPGEQQGMAIAVSSTGTVYVAATNVITPYHVNCGVVAFAAGGGPIAGFGPTGDGFSEEITEHYAAGASKPYAVAITPSGGVVVAASMFETNATQHPFMQLGLWRR